MLTSKLGILGTYRDREQCAKSWTLIIQGHHSVWQGNQRNKAVMTWNTKHAVNTSLLTF